MYSFRRPKPHLIPPAVAAGSAAKAGKRIGGRTGRSARKNDRITNAAVSMPTTPTPAKETLSSTIQWQEKNGGSVIPELSPPDEEGMESLNTAAETEERESRSLMLSNNEGSMGICEGIGTEKGIFCLDDIMEDLNGIWPLDEESENGETEKIMKGEERDTESGTMDPDSRGSSVGEETGAGNGNCNPGSSQNGEWNLMSSPGNSWEWYWNDGDGGNTAWGQEENTLSWLWDSDDEKRVGFEMNDEKHNAMLAWLLS